MGLSAGPAASKGLPVAEVLFFILGALFTFALVAAIVPLLGQAVPPPAAARAPDGGRGHANPRPARRTARSAATVRPAPPRPTPLITGPSQTQAHRQAEAYRIAAALDEAERTLSRIACGSEGAAAMIATQTLRRLSRAAEPPKARLDFARQRLELLSLRSDPMARLAARAALGAMA